MSEISIIVPVYNVEKYLNNCIDSILSQTYTDFELILVNDGSNDSSGQICDMYKKRDSRIKVFHMENRGVSAARNVGINHAKGNYICFIDSDDTVNELYLHNLFDKDTDLVINGVITNGFNNKNNGKRLCSEQNGKYSVHTVDFEELLNSRMLFYCYAKLFKTSIIKEHNILFNERISICEDTIFVMEYIQYCDSIRVNASCNYNYLQYKNRETLSRLFNFERVEIEEYSLLNIIEKIEKITNQKRDLQTIRRCMSIYTKNINLCLKNTKLSSTEKIAFINKIFNKPKYIEGIKDINNLYPDMSKWLKLLYKIRIPSLYFTIIQVRNRIKGVTVWNSQKKI